MRNKIEKLLDEHGMSIDQLAVKINVDTDDLNYCLNRPDEFDYILPGKKHEIAMFFSLTPGELMNEYL